MTSTIAEMVMGYGFAILLFAGLPAILFLVVFLPGLMRTTGETIRIIHQTARGLEGRSHPSASGQGDGVDHGQHGLRSGSRGRVGWPWEQGPQRDREYRNRILFHLAGVF